jgi:hypothetical protein
VQPLIDLGWFFANEFETFVQSVRDLGRDQRTRTERLFDLWVLRSLTQFLVNFLASFRAMMQLAQHGETQFLRGFNGHTILHSFYQFRFPVGIHAANVRALNEMPPHAYQILFILAYGGEGVGLYSTSIWLEDKEVESAPIFWG